MNSPLVNPTRVACLLTLLGVSSAAAFAQVTGNTSSTSTLPPKESETVELSPFVVSAESEEGYYSPSAVSASRTRTDLINLPLNVTVFNENFINDIGARELADIINFASGVSGGVGTGSADAANGDTLGTVLRGQGAFVPTRNGFRRLREIDSATISRVEVLKGPSSVLYGQASPGGSINYITKRPVQRRLASSSIKVGSYEFYKATADVNLVTPGKNLAVRFVGAYEDSESWIARYANKKSVLYPSLTWWLKPTTTLTVEFEGTKRRVNPQSPLPFHPLLNQETQLPAAIGLSWNASGRHDYFDTDINVFTTEFVHKFNENLTAKANYTKSSWQEWARTNRPTGAIAAPTPANQPVNNPPTLGGRRPNKFNRGSWDSYLQFELLNTFTWRGVEVKNLLGVQRGEEEFRNKYGAAQPAFDTVFWNLNDPSTWILSERFEDSFTGTTAATGNHAKNTLKSAYLTNQLSFLNGKLHTLAGARYDQITSNAWNEITNLPNPRTPFEFDGKYSPQFGAIYKLDNGLAVFANYSTSIVNLYAVAARHSDGTPFVPVPGSGKGWDAGLKANMFKGRLTGTLSFYGLEEKDIVRILPQVTVNGETFTPREQSGVHQSNGVELDLQARPNKTLQLGLGYAYTYAYVKADDQISATVNGVRVLTRVGNQLANTPKHQVTVNATQQLGAMGPFNRTHFIVTARWVDDRQYTDTLDLVTVPGGTSFVQKPYTLDSYLDVMVGFGAGMQVGKVQYSANFLVKNVFDERYFRIREYFGNPRQFEFSLGVRY